MRRSRVKLRHWRKRLEQPSKTNAFPADALERLRGRTLVNLTQAKDQPVVVGAQVFNKILYGNAHPYGQRTTSPRAICGAHQ